MQGVIRVAPNRRRAQHINLLFEYSRAFDLYPAHIGDSTTQVVAFPDTSLIQGIGVTNPELNWRL